MCAWGGGHAHTLGVSSSLQRPSTERCGCCKVAELNVWPSCTAVIQDLAWLGYGGHIHSEGTWYSVPCFHHGSV